MNRRNDMNSGMIRTGRIRTGGVIEQDGMI
jgi:hypothetical protein